MIDNALDNVTIAAGDDVTFSCNSTGYPPPTIVWYKNNKILSEATELSVDGVFITNSTYDTTKTVSYLYISGVDRADIALYHCQSHNNLVRSFTEESKRVYLQVLGMYIEQ